MEKDLFLVMFGLRVREYRFRRQLTQQALADIAGFHRTYIGMIERGEKNLTLTNLRKLAKALNVEPSKLLEGL